MNDVLTASVMIGVVAAVTWFTRGLPYLMFAGKKELPSVVRYLGVVLPPAIMVILVVYCLRDIPLTVFPYGLAELISVAVTAMLQAWKKKTLVSILAGTACYMVLIRVVFPI